MLMQWAVPKSELGALQASALETPGCKREKREKKHQEDREEMPTKGFLHWKGQVCAMCVAPIG